MTYSRATESEFSHYADAFYHQYKSQTLQRVPLITRLVIVTIVIEIWSILKFSRLTQSIRLKIIIAPVILSWTRTLNLEGCKNSKTEFQCSIMSIWFFLHRVVSIVWPSESSSSSIRQFPILQIELFLRTILSIKSDKCFSLAHSWAGLHLNEINQFFELHFAEYNLVKKSESYSDDSSEESIQHLVHISSTEYFSSQ